MKESIAIWNVLHDGEITVLAKDKDTLTMFVSAPYIRERIRPLGDSFVLKLKGVRRVALFDCEGQIESENWRDLACNGIEILSTDSTEMPVRINTTLGFIELDFDEIEISLDTGEPVSYSDVATACDSFWEEWSSQNRNGKCLFDT